MTILALPCGYLITRADTSYTESDLAWFRRPLNRIVRS